MRVFGGLGRFVHHGVGILDTTAIRTGMLPKDGHQGVIMLPVGPVALEFQNRGNGRHGYSAGLNAAAYGRVVGQLRGCATGIFDNVDIVSLIEHIERWPGNTDLCP